MSEPDAGSEASRALGTLLAVAAHELGGPLTGILAFARYAAQHTDPQGKVHELLLDIERQALRCTATQQDLLMFSRVSGLEEPARAQLDELLGRALAEVAAPLERHRIAVALESDPDTPALRVQTWSVRCALVSLLTSAIDALVAARVESPRIALRAVPDAGGAALHLTDNGPAPASGARSAHALARAVLAMQGATLAVGEPADAFGLRIWLPAAPA